MPPPLRGRLISTAFAMDVLPSLAIYSSPPPGIHLQMERCGEHIDEALGPASSARTITDVAVLPLLALLQLTVSVREDEPAICRVHTTCGLQTGPLVIVTAWSDSLDRAWRPAIHAAIANDTGWCICCNGAALRIVDARRTWSRDHVEFDLSTMLKERDGQALLWTLLRRDAWTPAVPALHDASSQSMRHGADVCRALGQGVLEALGQLLTALRRPGAVGRRLSASPGGPDKARAASSPEVLFEHSLTVLYRVLFLLFAEARGLVPLWHPVYRDHYSLGAIVSSLLSGRPCRGLWQAIQAISRLAHTGCSSGELKVTAFNGRLFSPTQAGTFDRRPIADSVLRDAIVAVSSTPAGSGQSRVRISYRDLDVEELGAVYEQVLDYEASPDDACPLVRTRDVRKSSGAFYTPRGLTAYLVRTTLTPLVRGRTAEQILALRIADPAMGSGAFLVAACRFLAAAAEEALIAEGRWHPGDVTASDRALLRREIASRCLYGVDLNPMAVQLARLSLWLATLAADRPLSFLDHHLVAGDSLVGATPADVQRQPARALRHVARHRSLPLFESIGLDESIAEAARVRTRLALEPDDTAAIVRQKERTLAMLSQSPTLVNRWRRVLDLWCAGWFWDNAEPPDRGTFGELVQQVLRDRSALSERVSRPFLERASQIGATHRFLHWPLAFPEVFESGGFDAVIGNPPWDMIRGDSGTAAVRGRRQQQARDVVGFFRDAGVYVVDGRSHANRYQLFVERSLQLLRAGGRLGLVVPAGVATDAGSAALRRHLFDRASVDSITGMDNRGAIFPIHRSVRFALVTATAGRRTDRIACRFGLTRVDQLDATSEALSLSRELLTRLSGGDDLGVPELASARDLRIVEHISARVPWLGDGSGWGVHFGRELNATDDRAAFTDRTGRSEARLVVEGKQIDPFHVDVSLSQLELRPGAVAGHRVPHRTRLAYRDVASATNRLTLIAALVPGSVVTTHTLFCLKTPLPLPHQQVLCGLLNSFVANYLIRLRVNTHVTATLMSRLPVPVVRPEDPVFDRLQLLTQLLMKARDVEVAPEYAELQATVAALYELSAADFEHVLSTFPLIPESTRLAAYKRFTLEQTRHTEAPRH
jgi:hypothetical protein